MLVAATNISSATSRPLAAAAGRNWTSSSRPSSTAVVAALSMPSRRRFAVAAAPFSPCTALRVSAFQGASSSSRPAAASASSSSSSSSSAPVPVRFRVCKRVPFGHTIAIVGVGAPALGDWDAGSSKAVLAWADGDVWSGEVVAERGATLEYKLVALDGDGKPASWQLGENRIVEVSGKSKVSAVSVKENWEGGEAAVEVVEVVEEEKEEKVAPVPPDAAPKTTAAAPVTNAPAPSAFVQKPVAASATAAAVAPVKTAAAAAAAAAPVPKPWASPDAAPAAPAAVASSSKALTSLTVPELKAKLKAAGLPTTGKKAELVARLEKGA